MDSYIDKNSLGATNKNEYENISDVLFFSDYVKSQTVGGLTFSVGEEHLFCLLLFPPGTLSPSHFPSFLLYTTLKIGGITLFKNVQNGNMVMNSCCCYKLDEWLVEEGH